MFPRPNCQIAGDDAVAQEYFLQILNFPEFAGHKWQTRINDINLNVITL